MGLFLLSLQEVLEGDGHTLETLTLLLGSRSEDVHGCVHGGDAFPWHEWWPEDQAEVCHRGLPARRVVGKSWWVGCFVDRHSDC